MSKKVSFQGVEGAYSHLAVQEFFPDAEAVPCKTFELAITAVIANSNVLQGTASASGKNS